MSDSDDESLESCEDDTECLEFVIPNFRDRTEQRGEYIESPVLEAHGYDWMIRVYPRGHEDSTETGECVSCYLRHLGNTTVTAKIGISTNIVGTGKGDDRRNYSSIERPYGEDNILRASTDHCLQLERFLNFSGDFPIWVEIKIVDKKIWYPKRLKPEAILVELYQDASSECSDVVFSVEDRLYQAHKCILSIRARHLYEIVKESNDENGAFPIPIPFVRKEIFKNYMDFIYTAKLPCIENEDYGKELLVAADRFDCEHLKLYVESVLVDRFLEGGNAASMLLFADSHSCPLLKEASMKLFYTDTDTVKNSNAWPLIQESKRLQNELLEVLRNSERPLDWNRACSSAEDMDVTTLRNYLRKVGLDLGGSREVLVDRLKKHKSICNHVRER